MSISKPAKQGNALAPHWVSDKLRAVCQQCSAKFGFVTRKHHCRACGDVFCSKCTKNKIAIPEFGYNTRVMVCDKCYGERGGAGGAPVVVEGPGGIPSSIRPAGTPSASRSASRSGSRISKATGGSQPPTPPPAPGTPRDGGPPLPDDEVSAPTPPPLPDDATLAAVGLSDEKMAESAAAAEAAASAALPAGWEIITDPASGQNYYANRSTGESSWERPVTKGIPVAAAAAPTSPISTTAVGAATTIAAGNKPGEASVTDLTEKVKSPDSSGSKGRNSGASGSVGPGAPATIGEADEVDLGGEHAGAAPPVSPTAMSALRRRMSMPSTGTHRRSLTGLATTGGSKAAGLSTLTGSESKDDFELYRPKPRNMEVKALAKTAFQYAQEYSAVCSKQKESKSQKAERLRTLAVLEILDSERIYCDRLETLREVYYLPLIGPGLAATPQWLSRDKIDMIFAHLFQSIVPLNLKFLHDITARLKPITDVFESGERSPHIWEQGAAIRVGDVLSSFAPFFKMYTLYSTQHEQVNNFLQRTVTSTTKYDQLVAFLLAGKEDPRARGQTLESFLIEPIQRTPRYELLVKTLLQHTSDSHPDCESLRKCLEQIRAVNMRVNDAIRQAKNNRSILDLQDQFSGHVVLIAPGRVLKRLGVLTKVGRRKNQAYEFILFNDMLCYAERRLEPTGWKYRLHNQIPLSTIFRVADLPDMGADGLPVNHRRPEDIKEEEEQEEEEKKGAGKAAATATEEVDEEKKSDADKKKEKEKKEKEKKKRKEEEAADPSLRNRLQIDSHQKSFVVYAANAAEKEAWLRDLKAALDELKANQVSQRRNGSYVARSAPVLEQYLWGHKCHVCVLECSFWNRRHCKACGKVVHDKCSETRMVLQGVYEKSMKRVCDKCVATIKDEVTRALNSRNDHAHKAAAAHGFDEDRYRAKTTGGLRPPGPSPLLPPRSPMSSIGDYSPSGSDNSPRTPTRRHSPHRPERPSSKSVAALKKMTGPAAATPPKKNASSGLSSSAPGRTAGPVAAAVRGAVQSTSGNTRLQVVRPSAPPPRSISDSRRAPPPAAASLQTFSSSSSSSSCSRFVPHAFKKNKCRECGCDEAVHNNIHHSGRNGGGGGGGGGPAPPPKPLHSPHRGVPPKPTVAVPPPRRESLVDRPNI